jgi:transmembrane sensor
MSDLPDNARITEKIEEQTSIWVFRHDRGLTAAEQDDFLQWLAEDSRHGECFASQRQDWERLDVLAEWRPEFSAHPNPDLLAPPAQRRRWLWPAISLAAAASIALGVFLVHPKSETWIANPLQEKTIAGIRQHVFEDGSIAELNRGAELVVLYTPGERRVRLERGEAYFTVAKDRERPFLVNANGVEVRAVGTAFNVRIDTTEVEVLVRQGTVKVAATEPESTTAPAEADPATVTASERIVVSLAALAAPNQVASVTAEEMERRLAWQPKLLDFSGALLSDIVEEFNRRNAPIELVIDDAALAELQLSATLRSDNITGLLRFLESGFGIQAERTGNTIRLRKAAAASTLK